MDFCMTIVKKPLTSIILTLFLFTANICQAGKIIGADASHAKLTTLIYLMELVDLKGSLESEGPFTIFAPINKAFSEVPTSTIKFINNDKKTLRKILLNHFVKGRVLSSDMTAGKVTTLGGQELVVSKKNGRIMIDNAGVIEVNIEASNGVIYLIDKVLIPKSLGVVDKRN